MNYLSTGIAVYAAVLSTFVFIWQISTFVFDRKVKIKVEIFLRSEYLVGGHKHGSQQLTIHTTMTNTGRVTRVLQMPNFALMINGKEELQSIIDFHNTEIFPKSFSPGDQDLRRLPFDQIWNYMQQVKAEDNKIRIVVKDTLGNTYKSTWLKFSTAQTASFNLFSST